LIAIAVSAPSHGFIPPGLIGVGPVLEGHHPEAVSDFRRQPQVHLFGLMGLRLVGGQNLAHDVRLTELPGDGHHV
jgi:hypothetical protein